MCVHSVAGPVGSVSSIMGTTWASISWSIPSYIPVNYPIITYEIGYHVLQSCSMIVNSTDSINTQQIILSNTSSSDSSSMNVTNLSTNTCYLFSVRPYTDRGYGEWTVITNETLELSPQPSLMTTGKIYLLHKIMLSL